MTERQRSFIKQCADAQWWNLVFWYRVAASYRYNLDDNVITKRLAIGQLYWRAVVERGDIDWLQVVVVGLVTM